MSTTFIPLQETIIAQCTPRGTGALALIRLSGDNALSIAEKWGRLSSKTPLSLVPSHTVHYGMAVDASGTLIDRVMFIVMHGPKTFTGEHVVEITCHNNPFIIEQIIEQALLHGARLAQEGEFTKRAYLHNKIDLVQAEAIDELIHANTQMALKKALAQLEGTFSHWIADIEQKLLKVLALSEASFEFLDDETSFGAEISAELVTVMETITSLKKKFNQQQQIRQGIRIALIGAVNAGKSSLFNALLDQSRAIVTPIAGTTRDAIEAGLYRNGTYWTLVDTAGLRQTDDIIEQQGIAKSYDEAQRADLILLIYDSSRPMTEQEKNIYEDLGARHAHKIIAIATKSDLPRLEQHQTALSVSNKDGHSVRAVEKKLEEKIHDLFATLESPFLLNQRQYNLLIGLEKKLSTLPNLLSSNIAYELVSHELKEALACLSELTGKSISEQGMDAVFKNFCVGK